MLARIEGITRFGGLTAAVEIVYGEKTFRAIKESVNQWRSLWPHARCWELSGTGHLPIEEAPGQLGKIIFAR
jgi:pimeloyl-ACP methyl ester carboxylesterase